MVRLLAIITSLLILVGGIFFVYEYYQKNVIALAVNPEQALSASTLLLNHFLWATIAALFLLSLLVYLLLTTRVAARRLAYKITKDVSLSQEQFRRFYEYGPVPYLLVSSDGTIERPNTASVRMFGLTREQLTSQNLFDFIKVPDNADKLSLLKEQLARKVPISQKEVQVLLPNGALRWSLLSIEDLSAPGFGHRGLVTLVDINEQKELDRIKTEFLSLASHQLRAPLANLKWYIDFLLNRRTKELTQEVGNYLRKMYTRNEEMIDLVNTLLNLSRIEMGRVSVQKEKTNISLLTKGVVEELEPQASIKNISLKSEFADDIYFHTDGKLVRIILQNLLANGIRYTNEGGAVNLYVGETQIGIRIRVQDNGIGIPPDEQSRIFQKMYRATNAKEIETSGNGIGLYMCKGLIDSLGGTISFVTELNKGTTFTVDLTK